MPVIDVDGIHTARQFVRRELAGQLRQGFAARYHALADEAYSKEPQAMARRSLRNACLSYLLECEGGPELALRQLQASDNMTDTLAALQCLVWARAPGAGEALERFEQRWRDDPVVMNKWFSIQAAIPGADTAVRVRSLLQHPAFSLANPNKVRSLIGVFSTLNPTGFHAADGSGYRFLSEQVIRLDAFNPQVAARMVAAFNPWTRYDSGRRKLMKAEIRRIAESDGLSPDVGEIVGNALQMNESQES
jgi:aminopeptidase N